jgi:NTP pyrophosphatase (non-canonical NTP hydrolase)
MTFDEYQKQAITTALAHEPPLMDKTIWIMGIAGEAGELTDKWKKIVAYNNGVMTEDDRQELAKEVGDILWYIALFTERLGLSLDAVAAQNLKKLADRKKRGKIKGRGDNR